VTQQGEASRQQSPLDFAGRPSELLTAGRLDTLLRICRDAIVFVDNAGAIAGWNEAAEQMFGLKRSRAAGERFDCLFPAEERSVVQALLSRASAKEPLQWETVAVDGRRSRMLVEVVCAAVDDGQGQSAQSIAVLRDVTEQSLVRAARSAVATEPSPAGALESFAKVLAKVIAVDNVTLTVLEGREARRVASTGRCAGKLPTGALIPIAGTPLSATAEGGTPTVCMDTREGCLPYDEVLCATGVRSYAVLPLSHAGAVVATLNVGFAEADRPTAEVLTRLTAVAASIMPIALSDALRDQAVALITHELRTPVAIIGCFAEELRNAWDELTSSEKQESVDAILTNALKLYRLVEDGLQITLIESGELGFDLRVVNLAEEVCRSVAHLPTAESTRIRVSVEPDLPRVRCDPDRHWQILMNLVSNALKFSPASEAIDVKLTRQEEMVEVAVRDHGKGINREDLPRLFRKFSQIAPANEAAGGTGLGLYISKALVEAQRGRIRVESNPGLGSTFAYTLPVADED
jgi:PAS domain S-box-containing protein